MKGIGIKSIHKISVQSRNNNMNSENVKIIINVDKNKREAKENDNKTIPMEIVSIYNTRIENLYGRFS